MQGKVRHVSARAAEGCAAARGRADPPVDRRRRPRSSGAVSPGAPRRARRRRSSSAATHDDCDRREACRDGVCVAVDDDAAPVGDDGGLDDGGPLVRDGGADAGLVDGGGLDAGVDDTGGVDAGDASVRTRRRRRRSRPAGRGWSRPLRAVGRRPVDLARPSRSTSSSSSSSAPNGTLRRRTRCPKPPPCRVVVVPAQPARPRPTSSRRPSTCRARCGASWRT